MVILLGQCGPNAHASMDYYFWMVVEFGDYFGTTYTILGGSWRVHSLGDYSIAS
jgi:hypothetical protein